jgi:hypothetical protein
MIYCCFFRLIAALVIVCSIAACSDNTPNNKNASVLAEKINGYEVTDVADFGFLFLKQKISRIAVFVLSVRN